MELKFVDIGTHMDNTRNFIESLKSFTNTKLCIIIKLYKIEEIKNKIFAENYYFILVNILKGISLFQ